MIKLISKCHKSDVESDWYPGKKYKDVTEIKWNCLKCGQPCKVQEIEKKKAR